MDKQEQSGLVQRFSLSLHPDEIRQLENEAKHFGLKNHQQFIRQLVRHYLSLQRGHDKK